MERRRSGVALLLSLGVVASMLTACTTAEESSPPRPAGEVLDDRWRTDTATLIEELIYPGSMVPLFGAPAGPDNPTVAARAAVVLAARHHELPQPTGRDPLRLDEWARQRWADPASGRQDTTSGDRTALLDELVVAAQFDAVQLARAEYDPTWLGGIAVERKVARWALTALPATTPDREVAPDAMGILLRVARLMHHRHHAHPDLWHPIMARIMADDPCVRMHDAAREAPEDLLGPGRWAQLTVLNQMSCSVPAELETVARREAEAALGRIRDTGTDLRDILVAFSVAALGTLSESLAAPAGTLHEAIAADLNAHPALRASRLGSGVFAQLDNVAALAGRQPTPLSTEAVRLLNRTVRFTGRVPDQLTGNDVENSVYALHALRLLDRSDLGRADHAGLIRWDAPKLTAVDRLRLAVAVQAGDRVRPEHLHEVARMIRGTAEPDPDQVATLVLATALAGECDEQVATALDRVRSALAARVGASLTVGRVFPLVVALHTPTCGQQPPPGPWRGTINDLLAQRQTTSGYRDGPTGDADLIASWQAVETRCLLAPDTRPVTADWLRGVLAPRLLPGGGASWPSGDFGILPAYAALRLDEIVTHGCGSAWWQPITT